MSGHRSRQIRMVWVPHNNMPSAFHDFKAIRSVQTPKVVLSPAKGRLSHACEEIVFSRHRASLAQSGKRMLYVAAISAWGCCISRPDSVSM
jgi:hypothetical protein